MKNALLFRDVTREAALHRKTGQKLRRVLDGTPDMIVATDPNARITELNRGAEKLTGRSAETVLGRPFAELLDIDDESPRLDIPGPCNLTFCNATGDEVELDLSSGVLRNLSKGTEVGFKPLPPFIMGILDDGGLVPHLKRRLGGGE